MYTTAGCKKASKGKREADAAFGAEGRGYDVQVEERDAEAKVGSGGWGNDKEME